jgi:hypothetical protein
MSLSQKINGLCIHTRINAKKYLPIKAAASVADRSIVLHIVRVHPLYEMDSFFSQMGKIWLDQKVKSSSRQDWEWFNNLNY